MLQVYCNYKKGGFNLVLRDESGYFSIAKYNTRQEAEKELARHTK